MTLDLASFVVEVPDFPRPGVTFFDLTPLIASPAGLAVAVAGLVAAVRTEVDVVVGMEARGFIFGAAVAVALGVGFVPVRKPGKLPRAVVSTDFELEYDTETLTLHADALAPGALVLVVDDVLATGGTAVATADLVRQVGAEVAQLAVVLELGALGGRARLASHGVQPVTALITTGDQ